MRQKRVLPIVAVISAAGLGNFGDELIRKLWLKYYENYSIVDISFEPTGEINTKKYAHIDIKKNWTQEYDFSKVDVIHFCGGGYINDEFNTLSDFTDQLMRIPAKIPLIASGISLQPVDMSNLILFSQQNWKLIGLRDYKSFSQVKEVLGHRASWSFDDTYKFSLKNILELSTDKSPQLFVNLQEQFSLSIETQYISIVREIVSLIVKLQKSNPNLTICIIEAHPTDARLKLELDKENIKSEVITSKDWLEKPIQYTKSDLCITSRFHPRLLFSRVGIATKHIVVGKYYSEKHEDTYRSIFFQSDFVLDDNFRKNPKGADFLTFMFSKFKCLLKGHIFRLKLTLILKKIYLRKYISLITN